MTARAEVSQAAIAAISGSWSHFRRPIMNDLAAIRVNATESRSRPCLNRLLQQNLLKADVCNSSKNVSLFDHFVGKQLHGGWHVEPQRLGCL